MPPWCSSCLVDLPVIQPCMCESAIKLLKHALTGSRGPRRRRAGGAAARRPLSDAELGRRRARARPAYPLAANRPGAGRVPADRGSVSRGGLRPAGNEGRAVYKERPLGSEDRGSKVAQACFAVQAGTSPVFEGVLPIRQIRDILSVEHWQSILEAWDEDCDE